MSELPANVPIDAETLTALDELKEKFGVKTRADVIRKALDMVKVALKNEDEK